MGAFSSWLGPFLPLNGQTKLLLPISDILGFAYMTASSQNATLLRASFPAGFLPSCCFWPPPGDGISFLLRCLRLHKRWLLPAKSFPRHIRGCPRAASTGCLQKSSELEDISMCNCYNILQNLADGKPEFEASIEVKSQHLHLTWLCWVCMSGTALPQRCSLTYQPRQQNRAICTFHLGCLLFIFPFNHKQISAIKCESLADLEPPAEAEISTQFTIHFVPADLSDH